MLGILLIYFVGKAFYELAHEHNKSRWGFAILGVVSYYAGILLTGVLIGILDALGVTNLLENVSELVLGIIAIPFGVLSCWGLYKLLQHSWENQPKNDGNESLDSDFVNRQP